MIKIISESNDFLKKCNLTYAFCGGYALELFLNKTLRPHSDVDIIAFEEDKSSVIKYVLDNGWHIYEHKSELVNDQANSYLKLVQNPFDKEVSNLNAVWAVKPDSSLIKVDPRPSCDYSFNYKILNNEQLNFDFLEIIFNRRKGGDFIIDSFTSQNNNITRELDKAILYSDDIPYLAPEIILLMISHPAYLESNYHREKNIIDFGSTAPLLSKESKNWLINALEIAYPKSKRIEQLKNMNETT